MLKFFRSRSIAVVVASTAMLAFTMAHSARGCTRAVYFGEQGQTVTGRTMDWMEDMHTNLWMFPRGMARDGGLGHESLQWTSKYGSLIACVYEGATADGINEKRAGRQSALSGRIRIPACHRYPACGGHHGLGPVCARQLRDRQ